MALIHINNDNFQKEVMDSSKTVLLDFWATWCGPCRMIAPSLEEIANEHPEITVGKIDVDESQDLARQFRVQSIPKLVVIKNGQVVREAVGAQPKSKIVAMLED